MNKRILTLMVAGAAMLQATAISFAQEVEHLWTKVQQAGVLKMGAPVAPPYIIRDPKTGEFSGVYVDLVREFAAELEVKPEFVDTTWENLIAGMQAGKWDMAPALNRRVKRALAINYSNAPWSFEISIVYNKDNPKLAAVKSFADFDKDDVTIAVVNGTAEEKQLTLIAKSAKILRLPSNDEARLAVTSRRADGIAAEADVNMLFAAGNKEWAVDLRPEPPLLRQGMGYGFRKGVPWEDIEVFNIFLEEKVENGTIKRMMEAYTEKLLQEAAK